MGADRREGITPLAADHAAASLAANTHAAARGGIRSIPSGTGGQRAQMAQPRNDEYPGDERAGMHLVSIRGRNGGLSPARLFYRLLTISRQLINHIEAA